MVRLEELPGLARTVKRALLDWRMKELVLTILKRVISSVTVQVPLLETL